MDGPTGKNSVLNVGISVLEERGRCWTGVLPLVVLFLGILAGVPELHDHQVRLNSSDNAGTRRDRIHTTLVAGNCAGRS